MELHYTHVDSKLRQTESQKLDVGKPLVASCELHKKNCATEKKQEGASAQSMGNIKSSKPKLHQTPADPRRPFTRKAECAVTKKNNEPEENDENEL